MPARPGLPAWALAGLVAVAGCSKTEAPAPQSSVAASVPSAPASAARPATRQGTLTIEGAPAPFRFTLFDGSALPMPFSTYVPQDMLAEAQPSSVRFTANFGGVRQDRAYLELAILAAGTSEAEALAVTAQAAQALTAGAPPTATAARQFSWSLREYELIYQAASGGGMTGSVALGRHGERWFRLTVHYPQAFADGFMPRARSILADWRWDDTGQGL